MAVSGESRDSGSVSAITQPADSVADKIKPGMTFDEWRAAWFELCRERGHELKTDGDFGGVDQFVTSGGYCNGPGCKKCGWTACMHCDFKGERIPYCSSNTGGGRVIAPDVRNDELSPETKP